MAQFTVFDSKFAWGKQLPESFWDLTGTSMVADSWVSETTASQVIIAGELSGGGSFLLTLDGSFSSSRKQVSGTVTGFSLQKDGSDAVTATGLALSYEAGRSGHLNAFLTSFAADGLKGDDLIEGPKGSSLWAAGRGNDTIDPGRGNDTVLGGRGTDTLIINSDLADAKTGAWEGSLGVKHAGGRDSFKSVEFLQFNDRTIAVTKAKADAAETEGDTYAEENRDVMAGSGAADNLLGLTGRDTLYGAAGDDTLDGGASGDLLIGGSGRDSLSGGKGGDKLRGDAGKDTLEGGAGQDRLQGGGGDDSLSGGSGTDVVKGGKGADTLNGGDGNDTLSGGAGKDLLLGNQGDDVLTGGAHADVFVFLKDHGNDTITDFTAGLDQIGIGRGASGLEQLEFEQQGEDVLVSFANVTILVENITVEQLQDADNFLF